ncbi:MAG TPA: ABC transporter ATP-binding protein [Natrialbaceae archaeon]|nr:ABC transporter ATP-binding protein [Natrialbaceae archaeon]
MTDLHLDGLAKRYGETTALEAIDADVREGEFFTLVGPSGCGKTTTLRLIAGFEEPTEGGIRFGDRGMAGVPPEDRDVGIVFQNYALFPHMTVGENVGYGLRFRDPPGDVTDEERISNLLELVDLAGFEDRDPEALSGGQQQRVALARALAPGPEVLLLDEPMSALDARLRESLRRTVREIQQELDITTVYVTHDQAEALAVSDRVAVMNDGRIEQVGSPQDVYRRPNTEFVARFVGENNVFSGRVVETDAGDPDDTRVRVAIGDAEWLLPAVEPGVEGQPLREGDRVTFCVRPADLSPEEATNRLTVDVRYREFLGEVVRVHGEWNGRTVVVRLPDVLEDDRLALGFEPEDVHVVEAR